MASPPFIAMAVAKNCSGVHCASGFGFKFCPLWNFAHSKWVLLHTAFYYSLTIIFIYLKYCWKECKTEFYPSSLLYPRFEKVRGILVYICPSFRPSVRPSVTLFRQRYLKKQFKIETSYLVYRLTMTSCIVALRMSPLLLVLPCICSFFFLHIFHQRYLHN